MLTPLAVIVIPAAVIAAGVGGIYVGASSVARPELAANDRLVEAAFGIGFSCGYQVGQVDTGYIAFDRAIGVETPACQASIPRALAGGFKFPPMAAQRRGVNHAAKVD